MIRLCLVAAVLAALVACGSAPVYYTRDMKADINAQKYDEAIDKVARNEYQNLRYSDAISFFHELQDSYRSLEDAVQKSPKAMERALQILDAGPGAGHKRDLRENAYRAHVLALTGKKQAAAQAVADYLNQPEPARTNEIWHCLAAPSAAKAATALGMTAYAVEAWKRNVYGFCGTSSRNYDLSIQRLNDLGQRDAAHDLELRAAKAKAIGMKWSQEVSRRCPGISNGADCDFSWSDFWKADAYEAEGMRDVAAYLRASGAKNAENLRRYNEAKAKSSGESQPAERPADGWQTAANVLGAMNQAMQQSAPMIAAQQAEMRAREQAAQQERANAIAQRQLQAQQEQNQIAAAQSGQSVQQELERLRRENAALRMQQGQAPRPSQDGSTQAMREQQAAQQRAQDDARRRQQIAEDMTPQVESFWRNNVYYLRNNGNRRVMCQVSGLAAHGNGVGPQVGLEPFQKAVTLWPHAEETPFSGPVGNPRFFGCKVM